MTIRKYLDLIYLDCADLNTTGSHCNMTQSFCDSFQPCQNYGSLIISADDEGYSCACPPGFTGVHCQFDRRPCKPDTCLNNGKSFHS